MRLITLYRYLSYSIVTCLIILLSILALIPGLTHTLNAQTTTVTTFIQNYTHRPTSLRALQLNWHGIIPRLSLEHLILAPNHQATAPLTIKELIIGFDWWHSFLKRQWVFRQITVKHTVLNFIQQDDGTWFIPELGIHSSKNIPSTFSLSTVGNLLQQWPKFKLTDTTITITQNNGQLWHLIIHHLAWKPHFLKSYRCDGHITLSQPAEKPATLRWQILMDGAINQPQSWQFHLATEIDHLLLAPFSAYLHYHQQFIQQGILNGIIQANWHQQWQTVEIQSLLDQWKIQLNSQQPPWQLNHVGLDLQWQQKSPAWQLTGNIINADWQRWKNIPGMQHLSGYLSCSADHGEFIVNSHNLTTDFGTLFNQPLFLQQMLSTLSWKKFNSGWDIQATHLNAKNADFTVNGNAQVVLQPQQSPWLNIQTHYHLTQHAALQLKNYLPLPLLSSALIQWLTHSITAVQSAEGNLWLQGYAKNFPYVKAPGNFLTVTQLHNVTLNYWPKWPIAHQLNMLLTFSRNQMDANVMSGNIVELPISQLNATIPQLNNNPVLILQGVLAGDLKKLNSFIQQTPLQTTLGKSLAPLRFSGLAKLMLDLHIPLTDAKNAPPLQVQGKLQLKHVDIQLPAWQIRLQNTQGQLQFTKNTLTASSLQTVLFNMPTTLNINYPAITLQGKLAFNQLPPNLYKKIHAYANGIFNYQSTLKLSNNATQANQLIIHSNLQGTTVNLPYPLGKPIANSMRPITLTINWTPKQSPEYIIQDNPLNLRFIQEKNNRWKINIFHPEIAGTLWWPSSLHDTLYAVLHYWYLPKEIENSSRLSLAPEKIRPLNIKIKDFRYNQKFLGKIHIITLPTANGLQLIRFHSKTPNFQLSATGEWIKKSPTNDYSHFSGNLSSSNLGAMLKNWQLPANIQSNNMQATFNLEWPGAIFRPTVNNMQGALSLTINKGQLIDVGSKAQVDIAHLLTLLSFQSLAQRLRLDFSDFTQQGFNFDFIQGNFQLNQGIATTQNTEVDSPIANIFMTGSINLAQETYQLHVAVTPNLTSSLPIIATIAGGPIAGAATWLANKMINPVINKITTDYYDVTGSWAHPVIKKL